jgi:tetratricopeptide (TPR) repeat protein
MGGQDATRGFLVQALIALLKSLSDNTWTTVTVEPDLPSDKVDVRWTTNIQTRAVQIKSSKNQVAKSDAERWAGDLQGSFAADQYELVLVGPTSQSVVEMATVGEVHIPCPKNLDLQGFINEAAHLLDKFLTRESIRPQSPERRELIVHALVTKLFCLSTTGTPYTRQQFIDTLKQWVSEVLIPSPSTLHTIPAPVADFTGRQAELETLRQLTATGNAIICGIRGMGGVGKTALACALATELATRYPDAQIKLDLAATTTPLSPEEALATVIHAFQPEAQLPKDLPGLRSLYLSLLHGKRALILADNAAEATQVRPLLPPAESLLIVTSRVHFALEGLQAYNLDTMSNDDAQALLLRICPRIADHAQALARACGCLPLALRAAASLLSVRPDIALEDYLRQLADESHRLEALGAEGVEITVKASLALSYHQVPTETQRIFRALAVFPAAFDALAEESICEDESHNHLGELLRLSLVDFNEKARRYRLHDLTRLFARACRTEPSQNTEFRIMAMRHAAYYADLLAASNVLYLKGHNAVGEGLALFDREQTNIEAGQAWAATHATNDEPSAKIANAYPNAGTYILNLRLHPCRWLQWLHTALTAARFLNDRQSEYYHLGNLGLAYSALGEYRKAIEFHEQALQIARRFGDRSGEGAGLGNLGSAYALLAEPHKAIDLYQKQLTITRETGDRLGEANVLGNLGAAYADMSQLRKAIEFYQQSLNIDREIGNRRGEGSALANLGLAYQELGEPPKAIECHHQALIIHREIGDRYGESHALGNLGICHKDLGDPLKAVALCQQQLTISREMNDRRGEGSALGNLGNAYAALGEFQKAIDLYHQAQAIQNEIGDRRGESLSFGNLGYSYASMGEPNRAMEFFNRQLTITKEIGDRRGEGNASFNMALVTAKLGQPEKAIPLAQQALAIFRQIEDPRAAMVEQTLAQWQNYSKPPNS